MEFFQNKNITLRHVATASALILSLIFIMSLVIIFAVNEIQFSFIFFIVFFICCFIASYALVYYFVEFFLYRKIKLLYKLITKNKKANQAKSIVKSEDLLQRIVQDVDDFNNDNIERENQIQISEKYRREFLGNIAHELKTPIFNIQGYVETLRDSDLQDEQLTKKFLTKAAENVDRLSNIVHDLIQITQYESGELQLELREFNITEVIHETFNQVRLQANQKNIRLGFKEGCDKLFQVKADRIKIIEVLENLIVNAVHYGNVGGQVNVGLYTLENKLLVEITDDGPGIGEEHLTRVFERFYRVDKHRTRSTGGTGLGLSIVKHIIEAHQQQIGIRSTEGKGATFWFTLQRAIS